MTFCMLLVHWQVAYYSLSHYIHVMLTVSLSLKLRPINPTVDASEAGEGSLEILVKSTVNGQHSLPTHVESLGNAVFAVSFTPDTSADHLIHVTFNDETVPGTQKN